MLHRGRKVYEPPRYMTVNDAARQLLEVLKTRDLHGEPPGTISRVTPEISLMIVLNEKGGSFMVLVVLVLVLVVVVVVVVGLVVLVVVVLLFLLLLF